MHANRHEVAYSVKTSGDAISGAPGLFCRIDKSQQFFENLLKDLVWHLAKEGDFALFPVEVFHLIGEDDPADAKSHGNGDFVRITFSFARNRAKQS